MAKLERGKITSVWSPHRLWTQEKALIEFPIAVGLICYEVVALCWILADFLESNSQQVTNQAQQDWSQHRKPQNDERPGDAQRKWIGCTLKFFQVLACKDCQELWKSFMSASRNFQPNCSERWFLKTWMVRFTKPVKFLPPVGIVLRKDVCREGSQTIFLMNNNSFVLIILHLSPEDPFSSLLCLTRGPWKLTHVDSWSCSSTLLASFQLSLADERHQHEIGRCEKRKIGCSIPAPSLLCHCLSGRSYIPMTLTEPFLQGSSPYQALETLIPLLRASCGAVSVCFIRSFVPITVPTSF